MSRVAIRAHGATHTGRVREANEDTLLVEPELGLYAVFDGMGGHMAGDVASTRARAVLLEAVRAGQGTRDGRELLAEAIQLASAAVFDEAQQRRDRRGMGTTVVACLVLGGNQVVVAHVGDSRAYLLRDGNLEQLTRDHTILAELLASGVIRPDEANRHPYQNVLSRNLGGKREAQVDLCDLALAPGDRLLLCSDGLPGFASNEAIAQVLGGAEDPEHAAADLVELALRGGGGDNVTAVVVGVGAAVIERTTQIVRTSGAAAWWRKRARFLQVVRARGLARSPICAVLREEEALEIVGGNLFEAVFHDLEQTTGIHVWTYAENLASGWLDQDGSWEVLRDLVDLLRAAAQVVLGEIAASGEPYAVALEIAAGRALVVAEIAIGGLLAERLRALEAAIADEHARQAAPRAFPDQPTVPVMVARSEAPPPEMTDCLEEALLAAGRAGAGAPRSDEGLVAACLQWAHRGALDPAMIGEGVLAARELYGTSHGERALAPLLDALDRARRFHLEAVHRVDAAPPVRATAARRIAAAHRALFAGMARVVIEAGQPVSEALREVADSADGLRARVAQGEARIARLEARLGQTRPGWPGGEALPP